MGLVETSGERLVLSETGAHYLSTGTDAWLLQHLKTSYAGFEELIENLSRGPATEGELLAVLKTDLGVTWETTAQVHYRLGWLENLGAVHREGKRWVLNAS